MEAKEMFMSALMHLVETTKEITQKEIADLSGIAPQTICNFVRGRKEPGLNNQERIAQACGYDLGGFLSFGRELLEKENPESPEPDNNHVATNHLAVVDNHASDLFQDKTAATPIESALSSVTSLIGEYRAINRRMLFLTAVIEAMADPVYIIKNGIVIKQNQKSRAWGTSTGEPLCLRCSNGKCDIDCQGEVCAIRESQRLGVAARRMKATPWGPAIVTCSPFMFDGEEYYVVMFTLTAETQSAPVAERGDA